MKKMLLLSAILLSATTVDCKRLLFELWIGGASKDGSGWDSPWGTISWGGGCGSGTGLCIQSFGGGGNGGDKPLEMIEIFEDLTLKIAIKDRGNIETLKSLVVDSKFNLESNVGIDPKIIKEFEFLDVSGKYFIPHGHYEVSHNENEYYITAKIIKL